MNTCAHCDGDFDFLTKYHDMEGNGPLCQECARRDIMGHLTDCDKDDLALIRKRIMGMLFHNKETFLSLAIQLISNNQIKYQDIF